MLRDRTHSCCLLLVFAALVPVPPCWALEAVQPIAADVAAQYNLIENGGFEDGDAFPAYWGRHPRENNGRNLHERDTTQAHSGKASAHIRWLDPIAGPNKAPIQWSRYKVPVEGGTDLLFRGYVRTEGGPSSRAGYNFYNKDGGYIGYASVPWPPEANDWTYFSGRTPVPPGAASMGVVLYTAQGGDTWYDDVAVLGTPSTEAVRATPRIDGALDEDCWADARALSLFVDRRGTGFADNGVQVWTAYDDTALYIAFRCSVPAGAALKQDIKARDGKVWQDDSVEVFLDPRHAHRDYYHFIINCVGVIRDAHGRDAAWDSGVHAATRTDAQSSTAEIAIPFESLALDLDTGDSWGINFVRNDRTAGQTTTWSLGGIHAPQRFGNVGLHPNLLPSLLGTFDERANDLTARAAALASELERVDLDAERAPKAYALLKDVTARIGTLRTESRGSDAQLASLRDGVAEVGEKLAAARHEAVQALFAAETAKGFRLVVASSLHKILRSGPVKDGVLVDAVELEAARDESESFQVVVVPGTADLKDVQVSCPPLTSPSGTIPIAWRRVEYVETGEPKSYKPEYVGWWPDILMPPDPFGVKPGERQPLWFTVSVPCDAAPGEYTGEVSVSAGGYTQSIPVKLRVRSFVLPRPGTLPCAFGLYAHSLSRWYFGDTNYRKAMPIERFAQWCAFLGQYRLTPKNVANEYWETVEEDGKARYNMEALEQTVGALAPKYYPPHSFCVYRLPCPKDVRDGTTKADPMVWVRALQGRAEGYRRLGLPMEAYIYGIDEPQPKAYDFVGRVYGMVREAEPEFPIMQTVNHTPPRELAGLVDIWCPLSARMDDPFYRERKEAGDTLWVYVCCSPKPPYANFFIDQSATDHRMVFWQARQNGATGVLYWCVSWWQGIPGPTSGKPVFPEAPIVLKDGATTYVRLDTNGDGILVWPGPDMTPYPSIRLEVVRDGIEDYEYFTLLDRCLEAARALPRGRRPSADVLAEAEDLGRVPEEISRTLTDYTKDAGVLMTRREAIGDMIERLVEVIGSQP